MKSTGNKCGHNKKNPKLELKFIASNRPTVIKSMIWRIKGFYYNPASIPALMNSLGSKRLRRSESRESIALVLSCILKYTNIASSNGVGWIKNNKFHFLSYKNICNQTGLSLSRVERAMKAIKSTKLVSVIQQCKTNNDGTKTAETAIKFVSNKLFQLLGLSSKLAKYRQYIKDKKIKREQEEKAQAHLDEQMKRHNEYKKSLSNDSLNLFDRFPAIREKIKNQIPIPT